MNQFTSKQEEVIRDLARAFHKDMNKGWTDDFMPPDIRQKFEDQYVDAILAGLKDPEYWGLDKPVFDTLD